MISVPSVLAFETVACAVSALRPCSVAVMSPFALTGFARLALRVPFALGESERGCFLASHSRKSTGRRSPFSMSVVSCVRR